MNEEYLWDKTGADAEIEALEKALTEFRYRESAPPALPAKIAAIENQGWRRFFQWKFALAAFSPAAALLLFVFWFGSNINDLPSADSVAEINTPRAENKIEDEFAGQVPEVETTAIVQKTQPNDVKVKNIAASKARVVKTAARQTKLKEPAATLTAEERYAYDQLMLALTITGSKLKIVKDKIDGIDEQNAAIQRTK